MGHICIAKKLTYNECIRIDTKTKKLNEIVKDLREISENLVIEKTFFKGFSALEYMTKDKDKDKRKSIKIRNLKDKKNVYNLLVPIDFHYHIGESQEVFVVMRTEDRHIFVMDRKPIIEKSNAFDTYIFQEFDFDSYL